MNLVELYQNTPVERHGDIKVYGDRVLAKDADGDVTEYLLDNDDLWLVHSDKEQRQDIKSIKSKLGIVENKL